MAKQPVPPAILPARREPSSICLDDYSADDIALAAEALAAHKAAMAAYRAVADPYGNRDSPVEREAAVAASNRALLALDMARTSRQAQAVTGRDIALDRVARGARSNGGPRNLSRVEDIAVLVGDRLRFFTRVAGEPWRRGIDTRPSAYDLRGVYASWPAGWKPYHAPTHADWPPTWPPRQEVYASLTPEQYAAAWDYAHSWLNKTPQHGGHGCILSEPEARKLLTEVAADLPDAFA